jgi:hypothetical protein
VTQGIPKAAVANMAAPPPNALNMGGLSFGSATVPDLSALVGPPFRDNPAYPLMGNVNASAYPFGEPIPAGNNAPPSVEDGTAMGKTATHEFFGTGKHQVTTINGKAQPAQAGMFGTPVFFGGGPGDAPPGVGVDGAGAFGGANVLRSGPLGTKGEDWDGAVMGKEYTIAVPAHLPFESPSSLNLEKQSAIAAGMAKALGIKAARDIDNGLRDACCCKIRRFWRQIGPTEPLRTVQRDESQWVLMQRANAGNPPPPSPFPPPLCQTSGTHRSPP